MAGRLETIHVVRVKGASPEPLEEATLVAGRGIEGDHHDRPGIKRAVTLVRVETIDEVCRRLGVAHVAGLSRRNLAVRGLDLDALRPGRRLAIGEVELEIRGPCDPCERMERAVGEGALALMHGRGGLTARVVRGGRIFVGDDVDVV